MVLHPVAGWPSQQTRRKRLARESGAGTRRRLADLRKERSIGTALNVGTMALPCQVGIHSPPEENFLARRLCAVGHEGEFALGAMILSS